MTQQKQAAASAYGDGKHSGVGGCCNQRNQGGNQGNRDTQHVRCKHAPHANDRLGHDSDCDELQAMQNRGACSPLRMAVAEGNSQHQGGRWQSEAGPCGNPAQPTSAQHTDGKPDLAAGWARQ
jgi:hypothetical protein